jgi:hypothetical protein
MDGSSSPTAGAFTAPHTLVLHGREMPAGSILCAIDCAADPLNVLAPVKKILEVIDARLASLLPGKQLVVLMGEAHSMPTHHAMQALLLQHLQAAGENFTVNIEQSHNSWSMIAKQDMGLTLPGDLVYSPGKYDADGQAVLSAYLGYKKISVSPVSVLNKKAFCFFKNVKTCFNDTALTQKSMIDLKNSTVYEAATEYFSKIDLSLPQDIYFTSKEGLVIRNAVMAQLALAHADRHSSNLIIQSTGRAHVMGDKIIEHEYKHSLCAQFKALGAEVLMVAPTSKEFGLNKIPPEAAGVMRDCIVVDGLKEYEFGLHDDMNRSTEEEWAFLQQINKASGGQMPLVDVLSDRDPYQKAAYKHAADLIERYNLS